MPQILKIQNKLNRVFKTTQAEEDERKLELDKLEATKQSVELSAPDVSHALELEVNSAEKLVDR